MRQLTQKNWTTKKEITVERDSLTVRTKNIREDLEYKIKFEELGFDTVKKRVKSANIPFFIFLLFDLLYVGFLINSVANQEPLNKQIFWTGALIFFSIITVVAFYNRNKDVIYLTGGQKVLELLSATPDTATVASFVDTVHHSMRDYYKIKFTTFDPNLSNDIRLSQLRWLKDIKAITDKEYQDLVDRNKTDNIIGFQRTKTDE